MEDTFAEECSESIMIHMGSNELFLLSFAWEFLVIKMMLAVKGIKRKGKKGTHD